MSHELTAQLITEGFKMKKILLCLMCLISLFFAASTMAAVNQEVFLMPIWVEPADGVYRSEYPKNDQSCLSGQWGYRYIDGALFQMALLNQPLKGKQNYLAGASWLGYFPEDPVEMDNIIEKVKPIIDKDFQEMRKFIARKPYFLFVGATMYAQGVYRRMDLNRVFFNGTRYHMPYFDVYDWNTDAFQTRSGRYSNMGEYLDETPAPFKVTAKEWKEKYSGLLDTKSGNKTLGSRLLLDSNFKPVLAQIFVRETGKTILKWSPKGVDAEEISALVPETPAADYDFRKIDGCRSLNPDYFVEKLSSKESILDIIKSNSNRTFELKLW